MFIKKFLIRKINSKHDFHLVEQDDNSWYFAYTGGQAKYVKAFGGNFHVHVGVSGDRVVINMVAGCIQNNFLRGIFIKIDKKKREYAVSTITSGLFIIRG